MRAVDLAMDGRGSATSAHAGGDQAAGGTGGVRTCLVGEVQGPGRHGCGASGSRVAWRASWWSGTAWVGAGRAGAASFNGARQVLVIVSAGSSPATAGRGGSRSYVVNLGCF